MNLLKFSIDYHIPVTLVNYQTCWSFNLEQKKLHMLWIMIEYSVHVIEYKMIRKRSAMELE